MRLAVCVVSLLWLTACSGDDSATSSSPANDGGPSSDAGAEAAVDVDGGSDGGAFVPGDEMLLTGDNPADLDEDPSVVVAADGSLVVAYFSQREGNPDIHVARTSDGISWTKARVTVSPAADYYPSLTQDASGRFHLTWFRWTAFQVGSIWYTSSLDPMSWDPGAEEQVTTAPDVDDWVPTVAQSKSGDLVIGFASEKRNPASHSDVFFARKPAGGSDWLPPVAPPELQSATEDDTLPSIARTGDDLTLVWVRCEPGGTPPCLSGSADLFRSSSGDGASWSAPEQLTSDAADTTADTLPSLYADHAGTWWALWISAPPGESGQALETPLAGPVGSASARPELGGYSPHVVATPAPGVFFGVWVEQVPNQPNEKDVYYRFFSK